MITVRGLDVRVGARPLLSDLSFHVAPGDRVGLVGRNGAGKSTLLTLLAGQVAPVAGSVTRTGPVSYLPQDPRAADPATTVADRVLSGRALDRAVAALRAAETAMADATDPGAQRRAMDAYARAEAEFQARGGYAAEAEAARVAAGLGLPNYAMGRPVGELSGGQGRRVELARILFAGQGTLLLDEPTNHLDADSVTWLRAFLAAHQGGLVLISHDAGLIADTVNRVFHLNPDSGGLSVRKTGWRTLPHAAGGRGAAARPGAGERRAQGGHAARAGGQDAGPGGDGGGRQEHGPPRRPDARRPRTGPPAREGGQVPAAGIRPRAAGCR